MAAGRWIWPRGFFVDTLARGRRGGVDLVEHRLELGIGAQVVEAGIVLEIDDPVGAGFQRAVEEELGLRLVANGHPGGGEVIVG